MEAMMMLSRWQKKSVGEEERNRAESVFAALKRAPRCALERTADQTFRFGKSKHFNLPSTCAIVGDFLFALSCNIAWLSLRVSALWLLRNYFTARPHRVKHDFGLYVPRQFCKVYKLLWLYYAQFARAMEVSNICESLVRYLLRYRDLWRHWARPLWNWAPCAGKQLGHITDCFMDSFKRHRNRILAWRLIPVHISTHKCKTKTMKGLKW